ncbi:hypothetical protein O6H91_10G085100 [Diphasiastrum complanatum]|uniref:Uncharacterized protein n=5 Tax=Diphasiastrum complanatum TaxID=34168 RepID=A0ACC2CJ13_DIPCM|nr:hypothetical protein O6H91_10G085100 [Diphasiastrum complanatum]KAJ7542007.1 hypothetical protein O6H91_10G085100 [Diphasiastrum complanatum]KAJ7542008.1 hypothetical protein O6H91_10G085100 [Diphasiastrum complanatum]KAJ7542009.1 hypothetical protein O6H91_10G085100 [Diphasiastrum complanatum]
MLPLRGPTNYDREPPRHPSLTVNSKEPFNAEPPPCTLVASFVTPEEIFYKRNHGPIPVLEDPSEYRLEVGGLVSKPLSLSLEKIRMLPKHTVVATLQCAGNRRTQMSETKHVKGVGWGVAALGNGIWSGVCLYDILELAGITQGTTATLNGGKHVEFVSVDVCKEENGGPYKASVPLLQATTPSADILLAYEMNGKELNRDHGYPLRVVVPGVIGARSVKWLRGIYVTADECQGFFMQRDYKMFPPSIDWHNVDWSSRRPLMDFPVQCAICTPKEGAVHALGSMVTIQGYALSGGGRGIERVDVSIDGGKTWLEAKRYQKQRGDLYSSDTDNDCEKWAWVLWEITVQIYPPVDIIAKAVDSSANTQPEKVKSIWNLRGVLNNSWHCVQVQAENAKDALRNL